MSTISISYKVFTVIECPIVWWTKLHIASYFIPGLSKYPRIGLPFSWELPSILSQQLYICFFSPHIFAISKYLRFKGVAYLQIKSRGIKLLSSPPLRLCRDFIWIQTIVEFKLENRQRQINVFLFARNSSVYIFKSRREKETLIIAI